MKSLIETMKAPSAAGPYSQGIKQNGIVFASGQLPIDSVSGEIPEDIEAQARASFTNLSAVLDAAGCTLNDVVKTTVFLDDMDNFAAVNRIYAEYFSAPYPARSCFQVAKLPKGAKVEIEAIAMNGCETHLRACFHIHNKKVGWQDTYHKSKRNPLSGL